MITAPEALFKPSLAGHADFKGIGDLCHNSVLKCDIGVRRSMYGNIVLSGGTTLFSGIQERLQKDISARTPPTVDVSVEAPEDRKFSVFTGASILTNLPNFSERWVTKEMYEEHGKSIIWRMCPQ